MGGKDRWPPGAFRPPVPAAPGARRCPAAPTGCRTSAPPPTATSARPHPGVPGTTWNPSWSAAVEQPPGSAGRGPPEAPKPPPAPSTQLSALGRVMSRVSMGPPSRLATCSGLMLAMSGKSHKCWHFCGDTARVTPPPPMSPHCRTPATATASTSEPLQLQDTPLSVAMGMDMSVLDPGQGTRSLLRPAALELLQGQQGLEVQAGPVRPAVPELPQGFAAAEALAGEEVVPLDLAPQPCWDAGLRAAWDRRHRWLVGCPQECQAVPRGARLSPGMPECPHGCQALPMDDRLSPWMPGCPYRCTLSSWVPGCPQGCHSVPKGWVPVCPDGCHAVPLSARLSSGCQGVPSDARLSLWVPDCPHGFQAVLMGVGLPNRCHSVPMGFRLSQ